MYAFGFKRRQQRVGCIATSEYTQPLSVVIHDGKTPKLHVDVGSATNPDTLSPAIDSGYPSTALSTKFPTQLPTIHEDTNHSIMDALPRISEVLTTVIPKRDIPAVMEVLMQAFQSGKLNNIPVISENPAANAETQEEEQPIPEQFNMMKSMRRSMTAPNLKRCTKSSIMGEDGGANASSKLRSNKRSGARLKMLVTDWLFGSRSTVRASSKSEKEKPILAENPTIPDQLWQPQDVRSESMIGSMQSQKTQKIAPRKNQQLPLISFSTSSEGTQKRHTVQITSNLERKPSLAVRTRQAVNLVKSKSLRRTRSCASQISSSRRISLRSSIQEILPTDSPKVLPTASPNDVVKLTLTRANTVIGVRQYAITRQPLKQHLQGIHSLELQERKDDTSLHVETTCRNSETSSSPAMSLSEIQSPQKPQPKVMRKPVSVEDDLAKIRAQNTTNQSVTSLERIKHDHFKLAQVMSDSDFLKREEVFSFPDVNFSDSSDNESDSVSSEDLIGETTKPRMVQSSRTESQIASQAAPPYINITASQAVASVMGNNTVNKPSIKSLVKSNSTSSLLTVDATISKGNVDLTLKGVTDVIYETICHNHAALRFSTDSVLLYREASHRGPYGIIPFTKWRQVHEQLAYVFECGELRAECAIITLIYIERMLKSTNIDLYDGNWRLTVLGALLLAVKVWDDCAVYNIDFISLFPEIGVRYMNKLERFFIRALNYDVSIRSSLFATEYFKLRDRAMIEKIQTKSSATGMTAKHRNRTSPCDINKSGGTTCMQEQDQSSNDQSLTQRFDSNKLLSAKQADKLEACSDRYGWRQSETMHDLSRLATTTNEPSQLLMLSATVGPYGGVGGNIFDNIEDFRKCNSDLAFVTLGKAIIN